MEEEGRGGAMAPERRGRRGGGESQAAAPWWPRPRAGPAPSPCPEASTAADARSGGELGRQRGRLCDSASRRFGGGWGARARARTTQHAPAWSKRAARGGHHARMEAESPNVPGAPACVASAVAAAGSLRGVPVRPRSDSLTGRGRPPDEVTRGGPTGTGTVPVSRAPTPAPGLGLTRAYSARCRVRSRLGLSTLYPDGCRQGALSTPDPCWPQTPSTSTDPLVSKKTPREPQAQAG